MDNFYCPPPDDWLSARDPNPCLLIASCQRVRYCVCMFVNRCNLDDRIVQRIIGINRVTTRLCGKILRKSCCPRTSSRTYACTSSCSVNKLLIILRLGVGTTLKMEEKHCYIASGEYWLTCGTEPRLLALCPFLGSKLYVPWWARCFVLRWGSNFKPTILVWEYLERERR